MEKAGDAGDAARANFFLLCVFFGFSCNFMHIFGQFWPFFFCKILLISLNLSITVIIWIFFRLWISPAIPIFRRRFELSWTWVCSRLAKLESGTKISFPYIHDFYIRWKPRTCCAHMKENKLFGEKKNIGFVIDLDLIKYLKQKK